MTIRLEEIRAARDRIAPFVLEAPIVPAKCCSGSLALECLQPTGSFKVRGATNKVLSLTDAERQRGVVTLSTGNHGRAVAWICHQIGVRAIVCMSRRVPANKRAAIEALGAEIHIEGDGQDEAGELAHRLALDEGLTLVPPFDDRAVIAGQGTLALDILNARPETDTLVVPLSGGGLLAGVALAARAVRPAIRIVGVSAERTPVMIRSIEAGRPVRLPERETLADSLLGGIGEPNHFTLQIIRTLVEDHIIVSESDIEQAMLAALDEDGLVLEGAGAASLAAVRGGQVQGEAIVAVASGGNVDRSVLWALWNESKRGGTKDESTAFDRVRASAVH